MGSGSKRRPSGSKGRLRLYGDLSWTWPIISPPQDYRADGAFIAAAIRKHAKGEARTLLDLGCGGGHLDSVLKRHFRITGIDLSPAMLSLARKLNPEATYRLGDMRTVRLARTYDAVLAYDSINYMTTRADLKRVFRTAHRHLRPGGVFVTLAEESVEAFQQDRTTMTTRSKGGCEITLVEHYHDPDPRDSTYESLLLFLLRRRGRLEIHTDRHRLGLFRLGAWRRLLRQAGFAVHTEIGEPSSPSGQAQPFFVCLKR